MVNRTPATQMNKFLGADLENNGMALKTVQEKNIHVMDENINSPAVKPK